MTTEKVSVSVAAYVTTQARLKLHEYLRILKECVVL